MVAMVLHGALTEGKVVRPWLGASAQALTPEIAQSLGLERPVGVLINEVYPGGPADRAGLKVGDVVRAVDGRQVDDPPGLVFRIGSHPVGGSVTLSLLRNGHRVNVEIDLMRAPEEPPRNVTLLEGSHPIMGATVGNLSPAFAEELGLDTLAMGVVILKIVRGSPAHRLRLRPGDIVLSVNSNSIGTVVELQEALRAARGDWRIGLKRGDKKLNLVVRA
jgi:serine protease Do